MGTADQDVWGLISDVHGNLPALELALHLLRDAGARKLAFLGDYLGRGDSDACVERMREVADLAIVGNRDLDWQDRVSSATKAYVLALPRTAQAGRLLLSHGDPRLTPALSTSQIARGFVRVWLEMERRHAQVWAFGHSHHARVWRDGAQVSQRDCVPIDEGTRYCLNVGTTGLPFPGKGGPSVALVDFVHAQIRQLPLERI
ncbi:MAG TPA: metallophosphoesterase family protein [Chloroflexota bacterium]|jgi:predicted phosphodiesterase